MTKKKTERIEQDIKIKIEPSLPKKKQNYIYVARDNDDEGCLQISFVKMSKVHYAKDFGGKNIFHFSNRKSEIKKNKLKLKKGEQKRIPIPVDKAEVVK